MFLPLSLSLPSPLKKKKPQSGDRRLGFGPASGRTRLHDLGQVRDSCSNPLGVPLHPKTKRRDKVLCVPGQEVAGGWDQQRLCVKSISMCNYRHGAQWEVKVLLLINT